MPGFVMPLSCKAALFHGCRLRDMAEAFRAGKFVGGLRRQHVRLGGYAVIRGGEGELRAQAGACPAGAVQDNPAAERLHAILQAD